MELEDERKTGWIRSLGRSCSNVFHIHLSSFQQPLVGPRNVGIWVCFLRLVHACFLDTRARTLFSNSGDWLVGSCLVSSLLICSDFCTRRLSCFASCSNSVVNDHWARTIFDIIIAVLCYCSSSCARQNEGSSLDTVTSNIPILPKIAAVVFQSVGWCPRFPHGKPQWSRCLRGNFMYSPHQEPSPPLSWSPANQFPCHGLVVMRPAPTSAPCPLAR